MIGSLCLHTSACLHRQIFIAFSLPCQVLVPVPDYTAKCTILVTTGKAKYDATKKAIVSTWLMAASCILLQLMLLAPAWLTTTVIAASPCFSKPE